MVQTKANVKKIAFQLLLPFSTLYHEEASLPACENEIR